VGLHQKQGSPAPTAASETLFLTHRIEAITSHTYITCNSRVPKLPSLTHSLLLSPLRLALQAITMGLLSLLPESLQTVETWIIRIFVRQSSSTFLSFPHN
jgi:hypothetical protein